MLRVRLLEAAVEEAIEAAAWYESERAGLGAAFNVALNAALDLLEDEIVPLVAVRGTIGSRGAMKLSLKRFPFDVIVWPTSDGPLVIAVAHHARRPGYWMARVT